MARASSIQQLPPDILEQLQALLRDPRVTQLEATARINAILEEQGVEARVSKSAVNRYAQAMAEVGEELRQSREVAEMWIAKLGAAPQGQLGHLTNEIVRGLAFDLSLMLKRAARGEMDPEAMPETVRMIKDLAIAQEKLEKASSENVKREEEIRRRANEAAAEKAATVAKAKGLSKDTVDELRREILGVA